MFTEKGCLRFKVLGTRGSMAVTRKDQQFFGGNTSCYMIQVLSHLHLDHVLGLGMYSRLSLKDRETLIYVPAGYGKDPARFLSGIFSPPYWPVSLDSYSGTVRILPLTFPLRIGDLLIEGVPGCHPGGNFIFRLSWQGRHIVYASDYEYETASFLRLIKMSDGADLVLLDSQYAASELEQRTGFGHSSPELGLKLMERCEIAHLLLVHHDPQRTDEQLLAWEAEIARKDIHFAREGEEILL